MSPSSSSYSPSSSPAPRILLLGKDGQVGWELQRALAPLGEVVACDRAEADFNAPLSLRPLVRDVKPTLIVNAAAHTAVDKAESEEDVAHRLNTESVAVLAEEAKVLGAWLVHYSTDYVFDGTKDGRYVETDPTCPLSVYGRTKRDGEEALARLHDRYYTFRTSWVFARRGANFIKTMLRLAAERESLNVVADQIGTPTSAELIADVTALALRRVIEGKGEGRDVPAAGIYHLTATGDTSWHAFAAHVIGFARQKGFPVKVADGNIRPIPTEAYPTPAARPKNSRLETQKLRTAFGVHLPHWTTYAERMIHEMEP